MSIARHSRREALSITAASAGVLAMAGCSEGEEDDEETAVLADLDDIPVGKATWFDRPGGETLPGREQEQVVVFRPDENIIKAYSTICTHGECLVKEPKPENKVDNPERTAFCFCHNGQFDAETGEVLAGPPPEPLNEVQVQVSGGKVRTTIPE